MGSQIGPLGLSPLKIIFLCPQDFSGAPCMGYLPTATSGYTEQFNMLRLYDILNCLKHILTYTPSVMHGPVSKQQYDQLLLSSNLYTTAVASQTLHQSRLQLL